MWTTLHLSLAVSLTSARSSPPPSPPSSAWPPRPQVAYRVEKALGDEDLSQADLDGNGVVEESEFVVFKLMETGMVDPNFVNTLRLRYRQLGKAEVTRRFSEAIIQSTGRSSKLSKLSANDEEEQWELDSPTPDVVSGAAVKTFQDIRLMPTRMV
jgi:hypothetical protein